MNCARKTKLKLKQPEPRNSLVAPVMQGKAGSYRKPGKALRQEDKTRLRQAWREWVS
ncbi:MAG: hypothetical protein ABL896_09695 [Hylemonella sp.]